MPIEVHEADGGYLALRDANGVVYTAQVIKRFYFGRARGGLLRVDLPPHFMLPDGEVIRRVGPHYVAAITGRVLTAVPPDADSKDASE